MLLQPNQCIIRGTYTSSPSRSFRISLVTNQTFFTHRAIERSHYHRKCVKTSRSLEVKQLLIRIYLICLIREQMLGMKVKAFSCPKSVNWSDIGAYITMHQTIERWGFLPMSAPSAATLACSDADQRLFRAVLSRTLKCLTQTSSRRLAN